MSLMSLDSSLASTECFFFPSSSCLPFLYYLFYNITILYFYLHFLSRMPSLSVVQVRSDARWYAGRVSDS